MESHAQKIIPVILSGGAGTRLWPLSRADYPKQFLALSQSGRTLLQDTARRVSDPSIYAPPVIVCSVEHRFIVAEQLRAIGIESPTILLEPASRNTAPALCVAALYVRELYGDSAPMLVLPSDHMIADELAFGRAVEGAAHDGLLVAFGVTPTRAETGYGYLQYGQKIKDSPAFCVKQFIEKPDAARAHHYFAAADFAWNSGIFMLNSRDYLTELTRFQPEMVASCTAAYHQSYRDLDFIRIETTSFLASPALSIDYAVMEHTQHAAMVALDCGWSDVGAWDALWRQAEKDAQGNAVVGAVQLVDSTGCYVHAEGMRVSTLGVENLVVVATKDAVLVARKEASQEIKQLVDVPDHHRRVYRPWGFYETVDTGARHHVKRLCVHPRAKLSLQLHHYRSEHWVIVKGRARIVLEDTVHLLGENESMYVPRGAKHRIENPDDTPLELIEVQSGDYLSEDDIVRFDEPGHSAAVFPLKKSA